MDVKTSVSGKQFKRILYQIGVLKNLGDAKYIRSIYLKRGYVLKGEVKKDGR